MNVVGDGDFGAEKSVSPIRRTYLISAQMGKFSTDKMCIRLDFAQNLVHLSITNEDDEWNRICFAEFSNEGTVSWLESNRVGLDVEDRLIASCDEWRGQRAKVLHGNQLRLCAVGIAAVLHVYLLLLRLSPCLFWASHPRYDLWLRSRCRLDYELGAVSGQMFVAPTHWNRLGSLYRIMQHFVYPRIVLHRGVLVLICNYAGRMLRNFCVSIKYGGSVSSTCQTHDPMNLARALSTDCCDRLVSHTQKSKHFLNH